MADSRVEVHLTLSVVTTVFRSPQAEARSVAAYDAVLAQWPVPYVEQDVPTRLGPTHVIVSGPRDAKPLLLLHGQDSSATSWIYNIADLSRRFSVHAVDTVGDMGKSRPTRLPASREDYAVWLLDVLDHLEMERAYLVGLSYGGFLAVNFALAYPERVDRVVLLAPGIPNFGPPTFKWASCGLPMLAAPSRLTVRLFINGASTLGYSTGDPVHEQMIVGMTSMKHVSFMRPVFSDEELGLLRVPTLLLLGDHEIMYSAQKALQHAGELIPGLEGHLIADAGHMLNGDQPAIVDQLIVNFLRQ